MASRLLFSGTLRSHEIDQIVTLINRVLGTRHFTTISVREKVNYGIPRVERHQTLDARNPSGNGVYHAVSIASKGIVLFINLRHLLKVVGVAETQDRDFDPEFNVPYVEITETQVTISFRDLHRCLTHWLFCVED